MVSGGYRAEVERMQREVLDYLTLEVTAIVHAAARSLKEQSRLVRLAEVM